MFEILKGTPFWVYLLLIVLIYKGIRALTPTTMRVKKLIILPAVFFILSLHKITNPYYYILFLIIGIIVGWLLYLRVKVKADKDKKLIGLPGSVLPLILIILAFVKGYYFGYESAVHPEYLKQHWYILTSLIVSGVFSGIFIGRALIFSYKYYNALHEDLPDPSSRKKTGPKYNRY